MDESSKKKKKNKTLAPVEPKPEPKEPDHKILDCPFSIHDSGRLKHQVEVFCILDDKMVLVLYPKDKYPFSVLAMDVRDTTNIVDKQILDFSDVDYEVSGTYSYKTIKGSMSKVFLLKPVVKEEIVIKEPVEDNRETYKFSFILAPLVDITFEEAAELIAETSSAYEDLGDVGFTSCDGIPKIHFEFKHYTMEQAVDLAKEYASNINKLKVVDVNVCWESHIPFHQ